MDTNSTRKRLFSTNQVAAIFQVDPTSVTRWAKRDKLPFFRTPSGHYRFREEDVRAHVDDAALVDNIICPPWCSIDHEAYGSDMHHLCLVHDEDGEPVTVLVERVDSEEGPLGASLVGMVTTTSGTELKLTPQQARALAQLLTLTHDLTDAAAALARAADLIEDASHTPVCPAPIPLRAGRAGPSATHPTTEA
ncbi:hypothetical protein GCM10009551_010850 [Nocardiopsis tropica]|uniref:helix-turn-helix domain-containing protein n=1 Tax=Nocardiopsis tropica TaxID=109330 RepID=UPI0031D9F7E3